jgi:hypothetical protein
VEEFANQYGLTDILPHLRKGALVAAYPDNLASLHDLEDADHDALRHEREHKWSHPLLLYITIIVCSIGAAVQGWDQTGSNGANLSFPMEFGIGQGDNRNSPFWERDNVSQLLLFLASCDNFSYLKMDKLIKWVVVGWSCQRRSTHRLSFYVSTPTVLQNDDELSYKQWLLAL